MAASPVRRVTQAEIEAFRRDGVIKLEGMRYPALHCSIYQLLLLIVNPVTHPCRQGNVHRVDGGAVVSLIAYADVYLMLNQRKDAAGSLC